ncbi:hypothetical protein [Pseudomonas sp. PGPR40]|uniref:hypothetical protein n=1 Tax=Pseudomonas sp. PGPR40 TaxID=2913476 RepID=UPI001EDAFA48|nr:hypothetical protein [Pseudomonas sp. PGPR40]
MSKADELAEKLKQSRQTSADATIADQAIDSWPAQVYELYHQIEAWLQPLIEVGLKLRRNSTHVFESAPDGASYDYAIDQLLIEGNHHSITFDPVARFTADGAGRIEIRSADKELAHLLRTVTEHGKTQWWLQAIEQSVQQPDAIALTEHNLLLAIQEGLGL